MQGQPVINQEEEFLDEKGEKRWLLTSKLPLRDADWKNHRSGGHWPGNHRAQAGGGSPGQRAGALAHLGGQLAGGLLCEGPCRAQNSGQSGGTRILSAQPPKRKSSARRISTCFRRSWRQIYHANDQEIIRSGKPIINREGRLTKPDGSVIDTVGSIVPVRDAAGRITGIAGITFDITDRKRAEEALRVNKEWLLKRSDELSRERLLLRTLIDSLPDAIYAKDAAGRKTMANPGDLSNLKCKSEAEVLGKTDFDYFPSEIAEKFRADDQKVMQGEPVINREEYFLNEKGEKRWLLTSKLPLRDPAGKVTGLVGIGRDITAIKEAEAKLEQTHKQLLDASRRAGMAEVATSVLHNVGNVLNSVNVASTCVADMPQEFQGGQPGQSCRVDARARSGPGQFHHRRPERQTIARISDATGRASGRRAGRRCWRNSTRLQKNIEHIKEIVAMQQNYAKVPGVLESLPVADLVEDAMRMNVAAMDRHNIKIAARISPSRRRFWWRSTKCCKFWSISSATPNMPATIPAGPDKQITLRVGERRMNGSK